MTRDTAPYELRPLDPKRAARFVLGPEIGVSYSQLRAENVRLRQRVEDEATQRIKAQNRLNRSMRVLASLGRLSPRMADLVAVARKEVWR